jgi:acylphosphatase
VHVETVRARVRVSGRVQGVYYRQTTAREAKAVGASGWVRNLGDGSVEAVIEGSRGAVERIVEFMRSGPPRARVDSAEVAWEQPEGLTGFRVTG